MIPTKLFVSTKNVAKLLKINKKVEIGEVLTMFAIVAYVPVDFVDSVVDAMSEAGAGDIGEYRACAFVCRGTGQFEPKQGANPFIGQTGRLEKVDEARVEMVCEPGRVRAALSALIEAHPYETPAYHAYEVKTLDDFNNE
jgi:hypothetical protein